MYVAPKQITVGRVMDRKNKAICIGEGPFKKVIGYFTSDEAYEEFMDYVNQNEHRRTFIHEELKVRAK